MAEFSAIVDEIKSLVTQGQAKNEEVLAGKADAETVKKMSDKFSELSETFQKAQQAIEAEKKARESLELSVAKMGVTGSAAEMKSAPEYLNAFSGYLRQRKGITAEAMDAEFKNMMQAANPHISDDETRALKSLIVGSNPDGGYLVPLQQNATIIKRLFETSPMRLVADVQNCSSEAMSFVLDDGQFDAGWVGESDSRGDTANSELATVEIAVNEVFAQPKASQKMLDDAMFNVEQWINSKVADKFSRTENDAFINGTGSKQPTGILTYGAWTTAAQYERNKLETRTSGTSGAITGDDLINTQSDLLAGYVGKWGMNRKTWGEILKLKDSDNQYLLNPAMLFSGAQGLQLLGDAVLLMNDLPAIATSATPIIYGDFKEGYKILDRIGIRILRDPYTAKGFIKFYSTKRTGGGVVNFQAIKRLKVKA